MNRFLGSLKFKNSGYDSKNLKTTQTCVFQLSLCINKCVTRSIPIVHCTVTFRGICFSFDKEEEDAGQKMGGGMQGEKGGRGGLSDQIYIQLSYCLGMHISLLQEL
jgi:hypothetical protein